MIRFSRCLQIAVRVCRLESKQICRTSHALYSTDIGRKNEDYFKEFVKTEGFKVSVPNSETLAPTSDNSDAENLDKRTPQTETALTDIKTSEVSVGTPSATDIGKDVDIDLRKIRPVLKQAGNLAAYVNESEVLQNLVKMGVNLADIEKEKKGNGPDLLIQLDFEKDVKPRLLFFRDIGVPSSGMGKFLTKNVMVLGESFEDMQTRLNYLESKKFSKDSIARIVHKAPKFLTMDVKDVDGKLGFYQKEFHLKGDEVRLVVARLPKLITYPVSTAKWNKFTLKEFLGFSEAETKDMFITKPRVFLSDKHKLMATFDYLYHTMKITHQQIAEWPEIFRTRLFIIKQRHGFLERINRAQYDPTKENYVSLRNLAIGKDILFCQDVAKRPLEEFNAYLKSL